MNKSVLISIQPKWCELIASGKKTIEVRKTLPQLEMPFKCYIYCTKGTFDITLCDDLNAESVKKVSDGRGSVIGEFVCDKIYTRPANTIYLSNAQKYYLDLLKSACLTEHEALAYMGGQYNKDMYFWHISDIKIYDKPKELGEFSIRKKCTSCKRSGYESTACMYDEDCIVPVPLTRPPQSWMYVEEI